MKSSQILEDNMPSDKVVRFGGSMQDVIKQFEAGSTDAFDTIIDQIQDEETSMIKFNKFLVEVFITIFNFNLRKNIITYE